MTPPRATLLPSGQVSVITPDFADAALVKAINGRVWGQKLGWIIPGTPEALAQLRHLLPTCDIHSDVDEHVGTVGAWRARVEQVKRAGGFYDWPSGLIDATPYAHQKDAHRVGRVVLERSKAYGLWHDAGLGKTLTSIALIGDMLVDGKIPEQSNVLVVCPSVVIGVWAKEAAKFARFPIRVIPLVGTTVKRAAQVLGAGIDPFEGVTMFVTNYEVLWRDKLFKALRDTRLDVMVCDEAHRLKSAASEQSKAARRILDTDTIRIAATGTPTDSLTDWYGIFRWLDPTVFGASFTAFKARYFITVPGGDNWDIVVGPKPEMMDELVGKAHSIAHACSKDEALDLPERIDIDRTFELEPKARRVYDELRRDALALLDDGSAVVGQNGLTRLLRLQQITGGFLTSEDEAGRKNITQVSEAKLKLLKEELTDALPANHKIVVFARFTAEVRAIESLARKFDKRPDSNTSGAARVLVRTIDGSVPIGRERDAIIDEFQNSEHKMILVIQIKAGGIGITLHAAHHAIFYSAGASHIDHSQARDRIHRIGQEHKCTYTYLLAEGTVDQKVVEVLRAKQDVSQMTLHQWKELLA